VPISLGDITFGIGPDTTRLRQSITEITAFGNAVEAAARTTQGAATGATAALLRQEQAAISALQKVQRFQDQVARSAAPTNLAAGFNQLSTTALDRFVARMSSGQLTAVQFQREMERLGVTMNNAQRIFNNWNTTQRTAAQNTMAENLRKLSGAAVLVAGPLSGIATRLSVITSLSEHFSVAMAGAIVGISAGAFAFYKLGTAIITVEKSLQTIMNTLTAVTGSEVIAGTQMKYLSDFADRAGVKLEDLAKNYAQITAAAKGTNLEGERTNKIFEAVTLAAGKLGLSADDTKGSLLAIQQIITKGTVQMEELKSQLGDRMPGALKAYADALGVSTQKFAEMVKKGEVGASTLTKFADKLRERYGINEDTKIDTIIAAENRLSNARVRALDTLDKILGVSSAYTNLLNKITDGINGTTKSSQDMIKSVMQIGIALTAAFAAPLVINAIGSITFGIVRLTAGIWALNAATAAGAFTSFVKLLATASIAIAAYYGSESLLSNALDRTKQSYLDTLPAIDQYIKAQDKLASSVRGPTLEYIKSVQEELNKLDAQRSEIANNMRSVLGKQDLAEKMGATADAIGQIGKNNGLGMMADKLRENDARAEKLRETMTKLQDILKRQTAEEDKDRKDPEKELTTRQTLAVKNAKDTVRELNETYNNMFKAPAAKEWAEVQNSVNKAIENFRDQLSQSELPAAKVTELTNKYAASLRKVKEAELTLAHTTSAFQAIEGIFSRGLDKGVDAFIATITEGKDALEALKDTAKAVAADILKTFMTLAIANPLKNALFGTNYNVLGGNSGFGGALGSLFGGGGGGGGASSIMVGNYSMPTFADGGIMTSRGRKPLMHYAGGGIARGSQFAEFGEGRTPEAFVPLPDGRSIPVTMQGAQGSPPIHIHEAAGVKGEVMYGKHNGDDGIHVMLKKVSTGALLEDIAGGGHVARAFEKQYGLRRTAGMGG
jgi:tape measure domain-containing protein